MQGIRRFIKVIMFLPFFPLVPSHSIFQSVESVLVSSVLTLFRCIQGWYSLHARRVLPIRLQVILSAGSLLPLMHYMHTVAAVHLQYVLTWEAVLMMEPPPFSSIYFPAAISVKKIPFRLILINIDYFQPLFICHLFCRCIDADSRIIMAEIQASQFFYNFFYIYLLFVCAVCLDCNDFSASSFAVFFASSMSRSTIATSAPASANAVAVHFLLGDSDNLEEFFEKKSAGDTGCIERWEDYLRHLSILINNLHMVLEHTVILGGHVAPYFTDEDLCELLGN